MTAKPYTDADVKLVAATFVAEAKKNPIEPGTPPWLGVQTRMLIGPTEHDIARAVLDILARAGRLKPATTDAQVRAGADALVRLRTLAPSLSELDREEQLFWLRDAAAVLEAAGPLAGTCPCTCRQPDRCPCTPGAPAHRHGAGGYCTVGEAGQHHHVIAFAGDGTWTLEHPDDCQPAAVSRVPRPDPAYWDCPVRHLAERQITPDLAALVAGGRYTCSAGTLGDVFQLGERLHDDQCTTPVCAACGCWCHAEEQLDDEAGVSSVIAASSKFARAAGNPGGPDWVRLRTGSGRQYEGHRSATCPGDGQSGHQHDIRCVETEG